MDALDQCVRRRARRRIDFPLHRPAYTKAKQPIQRLWLQSMTPAAIRDGFAQLRDDDEHAAAGRCRVLPLGIRLAGGHQRHARDDGVQFQVRRLFQDHRRPRADADAGDRGRARGEDSEVRVRAIIGKSSARSMPQAGEYTGRWFDEKFAKTGQGRRRPNSSRNAFGRRTRPKPSATNASANRASSPRRASRRTSAFAVAVRFDELAARGELALWFQRQEHAGPRAGALRKAQGADLSANRFARVAGGLHRHGEDDAGDACSGHAAYAHVRRARF